MNIATGDDVKLECGSDQLCSGIKGESEAAIHAMSGLYDAHADNGWGFLLMDAANAFQNISRPGALWNARVSGLVVLVTFLIHIEVILCVFLGEQIK